MPYFMFLTVHDKSSELGGAILSGWLSAPDAGLHEVAFHEVQHRRPILH